MNKTKRKGQVTTFIHALLAGLPALLFSLITLGIKLERVNAKHTLVLLNLCTSVLRKWGFGENTLL